MARRKAWVVVAVALALSACAFGTSEAFPITGVVAYKAGDVYTSNGVNYQDVMVGVTLSTNPYDWGLPADYVQQAGFEYMAVIGGSFGWMAQPQGTTQQNLASYNTWRQYQTGESMPSEVFLWSVYSVYSDGDFVMDGILSADIWFALLHDQPTSQDIQSIAASAPAIGHILSESASLQLAVRDIHVTSSSSGQPNPSLDTGRFFVGDFSQLSAFDNLATVNDVQGITFESETTVQAVPEPASLILLGTGLVGAVAALRKRRQ